MNANKNQSGFSLIELLIVVAIIGIIAAIAIPNLLASRRAANESSAVSSLRTLVSAQATYQSSAGNGQYAANLAALNTAGLIDNTLSSGVKSGYAFSMATTTGSSSVPASFVISAVPATVSGITATGTRKFGVDQSGVIKADNTVASLGTHYDATTVASASAMP